LRQVYSLQDYGAEDSMSVSLLNTEVQWRYIQYLSRLKKQMLFSSTYILSFSSSDLFLTTAFDSALREVLPTQNKSGLDLQHLRRLVREEFLSKLVLAKMKITAAENALSVKLDTDCAIVDADGDQAQDPCVISGPKSRTSSTGSNTSTTSQPSAPVLATRKPSDANANLVEPLPGEAQKEPVTKKKPRRRSSAEKRAAKREREKAALKRLQALEAGGDILDHAVLSPSSSPSSSPPASPTECTVSGDRFECSARSKDATGNATVETDSIVNTSLNIEAVSTIETVPTIEADPTVRGPPSTIAAGSINANSSTKANSPIGANSLVDTLGENTPPTPAARSARKRRRRSSAKRRARSGSSGSGSGSAEASTDSTGSAQNASTGSSSPKGHSPPKKPVKQNILHLLIAPKPAIELTTIYGILRPLLFPSFPEVSTIEVPLHASISQEQADEWSTLYWPAIYKRGNPFGPHPPYVEQTINRTLPKVPEYMALVREAAKQALNSGNGIEVGALVVDPSNEEVVAIAGDGRQMTFGGDEEASGCMWGNPLEHAVMRVVGMVAAKRKLREDLEIGTKIDIEEGIAMMKDRENTLRHIPSTDIEKAYFYSINKKQLAATAIFTDNSVTTPITGEDTATLIDTEKKGRGDTSNPVCNDVYRSTNVFVQGFKETGEYLCHNHIVYLTHEPCVMCSMALIHSRIGMVVIDGRKKAGRPGWGGLYVGGSQHFRPAEERRRQQRRKERKDSEGSGSEVEKSSDSGMGAGYGLFWRKELNWKFLAFEWIENGEGGEIDGHDFYA